MRFEPMSRLAKTILAKGLYYFMSPLRQVDQPVQSDWQVPPEAFHYLDKESAKFLFDAAEKRLKHLLENSDRTTNRAIGLASLLIPLLAFLLTSLSNHYFAQPPKSLSCLLLVFCWLSLWTCALVINMLVRAAFPRDKHQLGREPHLVLTQDLLENEFYQKEAQYLRLLVQEIEDLQNRIHYMQQQNNQRTALVTTCFRVLGGYAFISVLLLTVLAVLFRS